MRIAVLIVTLAGLVWLSASYSKCDKSIRIGTFVLAGC